MLCLNHSAMADSDRKYIQFPDVTSQYQPKFILEDGQSLLFHDSHDGTSTTHRCQYIDDYHFYFGNSCYHRDQFAEVMHRNGHTYEPLQFVTDLSVYKKHYLDRDLKDDNGKLIPYYVLLARDTDLYNRMKCICLCPQAAPDRQVAITAPNQDGITQKRFLSMEDMKRELMFGPGDLGLRTIALPGEEGAIVLHPAEKSFLMAVLNEHSHTMEHITPEQLTKIGSDFKAPYQDYNGQHPDWKGRTAAFLPGKGTTLYIQGISFVTDTQQREPLGHQISQAAEKVTSPEKHGKEMNHSR